MKSCVVYWEKIKFKRIDKASTPWAGPADYLNISYIFSSFWQEEPWDNLVEVTQSCSTWEQISEVVRNILSSKLKGAKNSPADEIMKWDS